MSEDFVLSSQFVADVSRTAELAKAGDGFGQVANAAKAMEGVGGQGSLKTTVDVSGVQRIQQKFKSLPEELRSVMGQALFWEAMDAFLISQDLVPVDTGTLKSSGAVIGPVDEGATISTTIGYGGAASEYAVIVHEDLEAYHAEPTQAKFLEDAVTQQMQYMGRRISEQVRNTLGELLS